MEIVIGVVLFVLVVVFVTVPLRRGGAEHGEDTRIAELEARKEAKYREIRDAQLDHAAGKLSDEDFRSQDAELRGEAVEILRELDEARSRTP